jgi:predicted nucleotidyltransferase
MMNRKTALQLLTEHKPHLVSRFGVAELALFGSTSRNAAHAGSDIDVLVGFDGPASSAQYFGVQFYLEPGGKNLGANGQLAGNCCTPMELQINDRNVRTDRQPAG